MMHLRRFTLKSVETKTKARLNLLIKQFVFAVDIFPVFSVMRCGREKEVKEKENVLKVITRTT